MIIANGFMDQDQSWKVLFVIIISCTCTAQNCLTIKNILQMLSKSWSELSQARLLRRNIAPFLDNWLLNLPWVCSWPSTDLLGDVNTLFSRSQLGYKVGHMLAGTLGLKRTLLLGCILNNSLGFVKTLLWSFLESAASRSANLSWFLSTSSDAL